MYQIKFNHNYKKLHNQKRAVLIKIMERHGVELTQKFVDYDTEGKYPIEKDTLYLVLVFLGETGIPFTTLRKSNTENRIKYDLQNAYEIVVEEEINADNNQI